MAFFSFFVSYLPLNFLLPVTLFLGSNFGSVYIFPTPSPQGTAIDLRAVRFLALQLAAYIFFSPALLPCLLWPLLGTWNTWLWLCLPPPILVASDGRQIAKWPGSLALWLTGHMFMAQKPQPGNIP